MTLSGPSPGLPHTLEATVAGIDIGGVGFLVGRDPSSTTCADDFDFSSN